MIYRSYKDAPWDQIASLPVQRRHKGNPGRRQGLRWYVDAICAFDIETTRLDEDHSILYIWQLQIGQDITILGRSWNEFRLTLGKLDGIRSDDSRYVIFVHNLAFEFQFLRGIFGFKERDVFLTAPRQPLRADLWDRFEFRCSYRHSNMSLDEYLHKMEVPHEKIKGFDYSVQRFPWTPLSDDEIRYCVHDVLGLVEAIRKEMEMDGDNLYTFPLTSTGYVRRDAKRAMRHTPAGYVRNQLPDLELYRALREAFRGGNTHANRYFANTVLKKVSSADRSSSYPDVMCNELFPVYAFNKARGSVSVSYLLDLITRRKKAVLARIRLWGVRLRDPFWPIPYLAVDKCRQIKIPAWQKDSGVAFDNGRILHADYLETTVTDIDLKIILDEYEFDDMEVIDCWYTRYGKLPPDLLALVKADYRYKTQLKDVEGEEVFYNKRKNRLNSYYGMTAQNPVKPQLVLRDGDFVDGRFLDLLKEHPEKSREEVWDLYEQELIDEYHRKGWLPYQWGVWVTSHARYALERGIRLAGDRCVYVDTDSVKYIGTVDWSAYNAEKIAASTASGAWADDPKGNRHYMGVYEDDGFYPEFATLGAKKYAYTDRKGHMHATISGVNKTLGGQELEENGGFDAFLKPGFVFKAAGGNELRYLDKEDTPIRIDGRKVRRTTSVTISPSTYTLGVTAEYDRLLSESSIFRDFLLEKFSAAP